MREEIGPMFARFTERARMVVELSQGAAREMSHNFIGTEHLLVGLLREEEGLAARTLRGAGVSAEDVEARTIRIVGVAQGPATDGPVPFTPRSKKVLEIALREALSLGHNHIGTEHLLLALVRDDEGVGTRILMDIMGSDAGERLRQDVIRSLSGPSPRRAHRAPPAPPLAATTQRAAQIEALVGQREAEIEALVGQLKSAWLRHPYMRLGQLVVNVADAEDGGKLFYVDDAKMSTGLTRYS